jgi:hypothetical protein
MVDQTSLCARSPIQPRSEAGCYHSSTDDGGKP